jgi:hypothetical protein
MSAGVDQELLWSGPIAADCRWVETPVVAEAGNRYYFKATGRWRDASIECDADGHDDPKLQWMKFLLRYRGQSASWFTLIGCVAKDSASMFAIGTGDRLHGGWTASRSGPIYCFANDAWFMYWNNRGAVQLEIIRLRQHP